MLSDASDEDKEDNLINSSSAISMASSPKVRFVYDFYSLCFVK